MVYTTPGMGSYGAAWTHRGYSGSGNVQGLLGSCTGRPALVCGNAQTVFHDVAVATAQLDDPAVIAVNDVGIYLRAVDHWVSLHGANMAVWQAGRRQHWERDDVGFAHSIAPFSGVAYHWDGLNPLMALSGYFAMQLAYLLGYAPIVLCGCPGDPTPRFFEVQDRLNVPASFGYGGGTGPTDQNIQQQLVHECQRVPDLKDCVRSMSGWTRDYFGGI